MYPNTGEDSCYVNVVFDNNPVKAHGITCAQAAEIVNTTRHKENDHEKF